MTAVCRRRRVATLRDEPDQWPTTPCEDSDTRDDRMRRWFGLTPRKSWHLSHYPCPRAIVGKRCLVYTRNEYNAGCICQRHRHILDHGRGWVDENGSYVHTAEPYDFTGREIAELAADLAALGVNVSLSGQSLWYPGQTVLLVMRAAET
jgi:hypothetical protein